MNYQIYPVSAYDAMKLNDQGIPISSKPVKGSINTIVNEITSNDKGYHELLKRDPDHKYKFFIDVDKVYEEHMITEIQEALCEYFDLTNIENVKFTESIKPDQEITNKITKEIKKQRLWSYHVVVPSYNATLEIINQHVNNIIRQHPLIAEYIDTGIYTNNRWFRLPNQTVKGNPKNKADQSKPYKHNVKCGEMNDFVLGYIPTDSIVITSDEETNNQITKKPKPKRYIKNNSKPIKAKSYVIDDAKLMEWLDMLPESYLNEYQDWSIITNMLKGLDKYEVWDEWSKKSEKYNRYKNNTFWRGCKKITFDINFLMKVIGLDRIPAFKPYIPITQDIPNKKVINNYRVVDSETSNDNQFSYDDFNNNDTIILKSCCGTGKTTGTTIHCKRFLDENPDYRIVSLFDRIKLGEQIKACFKEFKLDCSFYQDDDFNAYSNSLCCINSIEKIETLDENELSYSIFYLDEITTFIKNYTQNNILDANLKRIYNLLNRIIKHAYKVIVSDARINDAVFEFLHFRNNRRTIYIDNEYKNFNNIVAKRIKEEASLFNILQLKISQKSYFIFASDSLKYVENLFKNLTKGLTNDQIKNEFVIISSRHNFELLNASKQFKNKYVFYSPTILTGVDITLTIPQDVFVYIKGESIDAEASFQQTTRLRNIRQVYYYCNAREKGPEYDTLEDVYKTYEFFLKENANIENMCKYIDVNGDVQMSKHTYFKLFCYNDYISDIFQTNRLKHFEQVLIDEGFKIQEFDEFDTINEIEYDETIEKELKSDDFNILSDLFNELIISKEYNDPKYKKICEVISKFKIPMETDILIKYKDFIIDPFKRTEHFMTLSWFRSDTFIDRKIKDSEEKSLIIKSFKDQYHRLKHIKKLEQLNNMNLIDLNETSDKEFICNNWELYQKLFRISKEKPATINEFKPIYRSLIKKMTNEKLTISEQKMIKSKKTRFYCFNKDNINYHIELDKFNHFNKESYNPIFYNLLGIDNDNNNIVNKLVDDVHKDDPFIDSDNE